MFLKCRYPSNEIMKHLIHTSAMVAVALALTACYQRPHPTKPARGGFRAQDRDRDPIESIDRTRPDPAPQSPPDEIAEPKPVADPTPKPVPHPEPSPYAKKVEGKPGFVESPFAPNKLIDVRGLPPGTEIECPYTHKPILVP